MPAKIAEGKQIVFVRAATRTVALRLSVPRADDAMKLPRSSNYAVWLPAQVFMAGLESVPAFTERAKQIGISEELLNKLIEKNLDTYGKLAFICSSRPSSGDDSALFDSINSLIGSEVPAEQRSIVHRLWCEAHSHALVDLEARASRTHPGPESPVRGSAWLSVNNNDPGHPCTIRFACLTKPGVKSVLGCRPAQTYEE